MLAWLLLGETERKVKSWPRGTVTLRDERRDIFLSSVGVSGDPGLYILECVLLRLQFSPLHNSFPSNFMVGADVASANPLGPLGCLAKSLRVKQRRMVSKERPSERPTTTDPLV